MVWDQLVVARTVASAFGLILLLIIAPGDAVSDVSSAAHVRAEDFGLEVQAPHRATVRLGDETRIVLEPIDRVLVTEATLTPAADGSLAAAFELPAEARTAPPDAFSVSYNDRSMEEMLEHGENFLRSLEAFSPLAGWQLERSAETATLRVPAGRFTPDRPVRLRIYFLRDRAAVLESAPVQVNEGSQLEVGFALGLAPGPREQLKAEFVVRVRCPNQAVSESREKVEIAGSGEIQWRDTRLPITGFGTCVVQLAVEGEAAAQRSALWTEPRLVSPGRTGSPPNLVVVSLDTLRGDHVSGHGYPRLTTPRLDRDVIGAGTAFTRASTTYPMTHAAHMSLFTGRYPHVFPKLGTNGPETPLKMLAETVRDQGYRTAAFTEGGLISSFFGFAHGFDRYIERPFVDVGRGEGTFADGADFLESAREEPFFLFLHTYRVHEPYVVQKDHANLFEEADWNDPRMDQTIPLEHRSDVDAYDRTIRDVDEQLAGFLQQLDRLGLASNTILLVTSDHGEGFGEHGVNGHVLSGHEEQLSVPLVFRGPGVPRGRKIDTPVSLVDVVPTLHTLLGLPAPDGGHGVDLVPQITSGADATPRPIFFQWMGAGNGGVRLGDWKLIRPARGAAELYDLGRDPGEQSNLSAQEPERLSKLKALLKRSDLSFSKERDLLKSAPAAADGPVPEHLRRSLEALGYL